MTHFLGKVSAIITKFLLYTGDCVYLKLPAHEKAQVQLEKLDLLIWVKPHENLSRGALEHKMTEKPLIPRSIVLLSISPRPVNRHPWI